MTENKPKNNHARDNAVIALATGLTMASFFAAACAGRPAMQVESRDAGATTVSFTEPLIALVGPEQRAVQLYSTNTMGEVLRLRPADGGPARTMTRVSVASAWSINSCGDFRVQTDGSPVAETASYCRHVYPGPF